MPNVQPTPAGYTDVEALAASVQSGAITNGVTKAPTHDAVFDAVPQTVADNATMLTAATIVGKTFIRTDDGNHLWICTSI
jgi:hypothetical protein